MSKTCRRTGKDVKHGKNIRVNEHGLENFEDYFSGIKNQVLPSY